jgi:hypothetical protein
VSSDLPERLAGGANPERQHRQRMLYEKLFVTVKPSLTSSVGIQVKKPS